MREILIVLSNINFNIDNSKKDLIDSDRNVISEVLRLENREELKISTLIFTEDLEYGEKALKTAISLGVDNAYIINGENVDFYNVRYISKCLSKVIMEKFKNVEVILFGRISYSGDSFLLASNLADDLGYNRILNSRYFSLDENVKTKKAIDYNIDYEIDVKYPVVINSVREDVEKKYANILNLMKAYNESEIVKINFDFSSSDLIKYLKEDYEVCYENKSFKSKKNCEFLEADSDIEIANMIIEKLEELGYVVEL